MLLVVITGCVVLATIFLVRHVAIKSRLVEKEIDRVIARKLSSSKYVSEVTRLREDNLVMRNVLMDLLEDETAFANLAATASPAENLGHRKVRLQRYKETLAEAAYILRNDRGVVSLGEQSKATFERR